MIAPVAMIARAWRTPLGHRIDAAMARLYAGERAAMTDPRAGYACTVVAPILGEPAPSRQDRYFRRMGQFGVEVAAEALAASGLRGGARVGLFSGVGGLRAHWDDMLAAFADQRDDGVDLWQRGLARVHPYWMLRHLSNNVHAIASAALDLRGEGATFGGGTGGAQALAAAARALADGAIDAALVVAYDSLLEPETLVELAASGAATLSPLADLVAPYAPAARGFVPGEAAAAVVLVRPSDAPGAAPQLAARACAGSGALAHCIERFGATQVVVDGAAQACAARDRDERAMLAGLVGGSAPLTAVSAAMGQLGAATALVQAIALAEMLRSRTVAPIAGLASAGGAAGVADGALDGAARIDDRPMLAPPMLAPPMLAPVVHAIPTTAQAALGLQVSAPGLAAAIWVGVAP